MVKHHTTVSHYGKRLILLPDVMWEGGKHVLFFFETTLVDRMQKCSLNVSDSNWTVWNLCSALAPLVSWCCLSPSVAMMFMTKLWRAVSNVRLL